MVRRYSLPDLRPDHLPVLHVGHQAERLSKGRAFRGAALFCSPEQGTCPAGSRRRETPATLKRACSPALDVGIPGDMPGSPLPHSLSRFSPLSAGLCSAALKTERDEKQDYRGHSLIINTVASLWHVRPAAAACSLRFLTAGAASSSLLLFRNRATAPFAERKNLPSSKEAKEIRMMKTLPEARALTPLAELERPYLRADMNAERPSFPKRKEGLSRKFPERRTYASGSKSSGKSALVYTFCTSSSSSRASVRRTSFLAVSASTGTSMRGTMAS